MTDADLLQCAHDAFGMVEQELLSMMGHATHHERNTICQALLAPLREGLQLPAVSVLPADRKRAVVVRAAKTLIHKMVERTS